MENQAIISPRGKLMIKGKNWGLREGVSEVAWASVKESASGWAARDGRGREGSTCCS